MSFFWYLFILLIVSLIADYAFQSEFLAKYKHENWLVMTVHCLIWTGCIAITLWFMFPAIIPWWQIVMLFVGHYVMDYWKSGHPSEKKYLWTYYLDQSFHVLQIVIALGMSFFATLI